MWKLIRNSIFFLLPLLTALIILPVNERLKFQGLKEDCSNHGIWIYDRIYNNPDPIDIAFIGSSHTFNDINDKLITDNISKKKVVNLGYCRLGRNFSYALSKVLIGQRKVISLVIEVREDEDRYSHPIFPYIANTRDVVLPNPFFNRDIISDMWTHFAYKIELTQELLYQQEVEMPIQINDYGHGTSKDTVSVEFLEEVKVRRTKYKKPIPKLIRDFHEKFARVYLKKISKLCIENNVNLYFVYLPAYGSGVNKPKEYDTYSKYGDVLIPPMEIFEDKSHWCDENHLNEAGAKELSLWLSKLIENDW